MRLFTKTICIVLLQCAAIFGENPKLESDSNSEKRTTGTATCLATGDPHYRTFDGKGYNHMGLCEYVMSKDVNDKFKVLIKNERCGHRASCVASVTVHVMNMMIKISRGGIFTLFGIAKNTPFTYKGVRVNKIGRTKTIQIDTDIGLTVRYDGVYNVYITLSSRYRGKVVGLCGNYNGNINDEYLDVNSHLSVSVSEFADSWNVDRRCKGTTEPENPCLAANNIAQEAKKRCQLLKEQPFAKCNNLVKPDSGFIEDCEYDVCACNNHPASCLCEEFDAYATMCSIVGDPIIWRNHSQFSECNSSCAEAPCRNGATCINRGKDYNCKCADGYSGKQCDIRTCENPKPLGMESRKIADSRITASSQYSASYRASYARLNSNTYWLSKPNNRNQWLKIDFKYRATITDILSQGRGSSNQYVRTYTLSYSDDGINFKSYQRSGKKRVLKANVNDKCIAKTTLEPVIVARFIRIHPVTWKGHISMRVEFIGCFEGQPCAEEPCQNEGKCSDIGGQAHCSCLAGYYGEKCEETECKKPVSLGMENGDIPDSQLSASSEVNVHHGAVNARLNFRGQGSRVGAWCGHNDLKQWLEVNFVLQATVTDILTQGRFRHNQWVTKYTVSYSNDGLNFFDYRVNGVVKVFDGNRNRNGIVSNSLSPVILTKHIRIHPKKYYGYTCMRVDFRGCLKEWPCEARPCRNAGTCFDFRGHYRCACAKGWGGKNCEQNIDDPCDPTPCRNGGTCLAYRGHYRCACGEGWAGKNCEQNVEHCERLVPQNKVENGRK